ncbi:MAG: type II toxin-antitoxin system RelE/ParE family toxin [Nostoc sp.]|uniref:type II toxin-antitoxin system RelE/ParE family toxin n=1 Tax=Nostoc sp. TaxID=1180 RepID=UPI002FF769A2
MENLQVEDFKDYLIFYRIQDATVEILRVFHGVGYFADLLGELNEDFNTDLI